jgi:hypothetical protein
VIIDRADRVPRLLAAAAILAGLAGWAYYVGQDLVLSHYDAKAHLVVARRVFDNMTPGWRQIGAVWLPLPHLLNLLPAQVDVLYRTGAFASLISIACLGLTTWASARIVLLTTGSVLGAAVAASLLVLNPNLLYLHVTPMTEPLSIAANVVTALWLCEWAKAGFGRVPLKLGWALFLAAWTRYESWAFLGATFVCVPFVMWRAGVAPRTIADRFVRLALWPAAAVSIFVINSRLATGSWFVGNEFYVPDPYYDGLAPRTAIALWWGTHRLSGYVVETIALVFAAWFVIRAVRSRADAYLAFPIALFATAALPFVAFYQGHPYRVRYMIPLVATCALFGGLGAGAMVRMKPDTAVLTGVVRFAVAILLLASTIIESPPWRGDSELLLEAQWDIPASRARRVVTGCLMQYDDTKVLASMGSLAHYMQELSRQGFDIDDFVHEGNGAIWDLARETGAAPHAGWMLVEEKAEGGDVLAKRIQEDASFARGMTRVCEGGGVALYRRGRS